MNPVLGALAFSVTLVTLGWALAQLLETLFDDEEDDGTGED